jgi:hypothetical protein
MEPPRAAQSRLVDSGGQFPVTTKHRERPFAQERQDHEQKEPVGKQGKPQDVTSRGSSAMQKPIRNRRRRRYRFHYLQKEH